jgi:phage-related minor tail protein
VADRSLRIRMLIEAGDKFSRPMRALGAGSRRAATELDRTRKSLKELQAVEADVGAYRKLKGDLTDLQRRLAWAQTRVSDLGREMTAAGKPTKALTRDYERAKKAAADLGAEHTRETSKLLQLRDRLSGAGIAITRLSEGERRLKDNISATNREISEQERRMTQAADRSRRFNAGRQSFDTINNRATGLAAGGMSSIATARGIAQPLLDADEAARGFQARMTDIALKTNMSRVETTRFGSQITAAARAANQLPTTMQAGVDALMGMGEDDPRSALYMMRAIGRASTAYQAEIDDMARASWSLKDNLGVAVGDTSKAIDIMAVAGKRGSFEIKDMASSFPELTASMQALNSRGTPAVADLAAALQIARKGAGDSASAANNLQNLLAKINTKDTYDNFAKFGIDIPAAMKRAAAESRSPIEEIIELTRRATGGDTAKLAFLFGDMQVQQALRPLLANTKLYREIRDEALKASGTTDRDFVRRMEDPEQRAQRFRVNRQALAITAGSQVQGPLGALRDRASGLMERWSAWSDQNPKLARGLGTLTLGLAGLFLILGGGAIVIAGMLAPFAALAATASFLSIGMLPLAGTVLAVVAAIGLLGAGAYLLVQRWGSVTSFFQGLGGWFSARWAEVQQAFQWGLVGIVGLLLRWGGSLLATLLRAVGGAVVGLINFLPTALNGVGRAFVFMFTNVLTPIVGLFRQFGVNTIRGFIEGFLSLDGWMMQRIDKFVARFTGRSRKNLGIRSPSRVFHEIGGHVMAGLHNGLAAGEDAPIGRIDRLSRRLGQALVVGASVPAIASPTAAAPAALRGQAAAPAPSIHITMTGDIVIKGGPDKSAREFAEDIKRELMRPAFGAARGAGTGVSFADLPDWRD